VSGLDWLTVRPVAHRGLHDVARGVIENTPTAFAAAVTARYGIECDLQITVDGEAMVHHDDALGRLTEGSGRLDEMTGAELRGVPFKATGDRMISFGDLCDLVAGRVTLLIELKRPRADDGRLVRRAAAVLSGYRGPAGLMSFDPAQIASLRAIAPKLTRGFVAEGGADDPAWRHARIRTALAYIRDALRMKPQFLAYAVKDLPAPLPSAARRCGLPVLTWTVRSAEDRQRAERWADQMIFEGFRP
jgi:glycerophosphoryl diester phosphodiesterase